MCVFAWQSSNQIALFCFFYHIQTYCSWLAPLLLQLPSLGEEKYTAVSAKHCQTLQGCNVYPLSFFFGTKHWWLEVWQNSFIHLFFFGAFAAVKSSRVPVKQTRHAETEQGNAGGEIFLPLATMLRPCLGGNHRLWNLRFGVQPMASCHSNVVSKDCTHGKDKEFNFLIHLHQVVQVDPGMTGKESSSWMAVFPP